MTILRSPCTLFDNYEDITSEVINKLLVNRQISITQDELDKIKNIPSVKFDLPLNDVTYRAFASLVGKPAGTVRREGIYIFTHKGSGDKYVGSSNSLSRRLNQYFSKEHLFKEANYELLLPLLKKEGLRAFNLEIIVMPFESYSTNSFLFLEQYYLLHKDFNLNTQKIVNFRVNQGMKIYLYDKECKILYYASKSVRQMCDDIGISHLTVKKCVEKESLYLNYFKISRILLEGAERWNLNLQELGGFIAKKKREFLKYNVINKLIVGNIKKDNSKPITIKHIESGKTINFPSIVAAGKYLESINNKVSIPTIRRNLNTGKVTNGYKFYETYL